MSRNTPERCSGWNLSSRNAVPEIMCDTLTREIIAQKNHGNCLNLTLIWVSENAATSAHVSPYMSKKTFSGWGFVPDPAGGQDASPGQKMWGGQPLVRGSGEAKPLEAENLLALVPNESSNFASFSVFFILYLSVRLSFCLYVYCVYELHNSYSNNNFTNDLWQKWGGHVHPMATPLGGLISPPRRPPF